MYGEMNGVNGHNDTNSWTLEKSLRDLWSVVLDIEPYDILQTSHLFELGADSVSVIRLLNRALNYGISIEPSTVYQCPVFRDMLVHCNASCSESVVASVERSPAPTTDLRSWAAVQCAVEAGEIDHVMQCTAIQKDFMQSHIDSGLYLFQATFRLQGPLDWFCSAWNHIVSTNPIFRTRFVRRNTEWYQVVVNEEVQWTIGHDLHSYKARDRARGVKLGRPLSRQAIVYEDDQVWFVWTVLHAIQDGWTRRLIYQDLQDYFTDPKTFLERPLRPPFSQFTDFLQNIGQARGLSHWQTLLQGVENFDLLYPASWHKPQVALTRISKIIAVSKPTNLQIGQAAIAHAAWSLVLHVFSGSDDIFFASDRTGRACGLNGVDKIMGAMLATVPFRIRLRMNESLSDFLYEVQQQLIAGIPFEAWGREALWQHFGHNKYIQSNLLPQLSERDFLYDAMSITEGDHKMSITPVEQYISPCEVGLLLSSYPRGEGQQFIVAKFDEELIPYERMNNLVDLYGTTLALLSTHSSSTEPLHKHVEKLSEKHFQAVGSERPECQTRSPVIETLPDLIENTARSTALILPQKDSMSITGASLKSLVHKAQLELRRFGIKRGDTVSIAMPNSLEFIVLFFATTSIGAIAAPLNPSYRQNEFSYYFEAARSNLVVIARESHTNKSFTIQAACEKEIPVVEVHTNGTNVEFAVVSGQIPEAVLADGPRVELQPDDVALLLYTSGTTGRPKAVPLKHGNLIHGAQTMTETYELSPADRSMLIMPLFHIHGIVAGMLGPLLSRSILVVSSSVQPNFWQLAARNRITWFTGTPTMHKMVMQLPGPDNKPKLRFVRSCSSPLAPSLMAELEVLYNCPVLEAYAMTEAAHQMTSNRLQEGQRIPESVGKPTRIELCVVGEDEAIVSTGTSGEICVRGPSIMKGYLDNPEANRNAFTKDGFLKTGDQGKQTPDGSVFITGRMKELINKGGEKISPIEVDNVLYKHEAISEAVSFAIPDEMYGETVGAAVLFKPDKTVTVHELRKWMLEQMSAHKVPSKFFFPESIPRTATGKLQRLAVAKELLQLPN